MQGREAGRLSRGTKQRGFRCEDELWDKAKALADERNDNLSDILRQALANYISEGTKNDK
jgi:hypothetical protein